VQNPDEFFKGLGLEPFDPALKNGGLYELLQGRKKQIKPLLLDQTFISGIGNIYADEALHMAKIHPLTRADQITKEQASFLLKAIRKVLQTGIKHNGASIDWVYRGGSYQNHFRVYQRSGDPCPVCGAEIQRIRIGQRSTHFCPVCQVEPDIAQNKLKGK